MTRRDWWMGIAVLVIVVIGAAVFASKAVWTNGSQPWVATDGEIAADKGREEEMAAIKAKWDKVSQAGDAAADVVKQADADYEAKRIKTKTEYDAIIAKIKEAEAEHDRLYKEAGGSLDEVGAGEFRWHEFHPWPYR